MTRLEWKEYTNDRLIAEHPSGFYVVRPKESIQGRPIFCPLCDWFMNTHYDPESYEKFGCCESCAGSWAYPNIEKWKNGWRPSKDEARNKRRRPDM